MKTKSITQIQKIKQKYESNQQFILQSGTITERNYNNFIFDLGCEFLDQFYDHPDMSKYRDLHVVSVDYWNWFKFQYKKWENEYLITMEVVDPSMADLKEQLGQMVACRHVEDSFGHTYLKNCKIP